MSGLLIKEVSTLKRYTRQYVLLFLFFCAFSVYLNEASYMQTMLMMILGMLTLTGMSYDHMAGWDKLALTMPLERKTIVLSKYLINFIFLIAGMVIGSISGLVMSALLPNSEEGVMEVLFLSGFMFCFILFIYSLLIPLIYKFGVERARTLTFVVIILPVVMIMSIAKAAPPSLIQLIETETLLVIGGLALICAVIYIISYFISLRIYEGKEF